MAVLDTLLLNTLQKVKGFIFDCDGVLFDSQYANILYINEHLVQLNLKPLPLNEPEYTYIFSLTLEAIIEDLAPGIPSNQIKRVIEKVKYDDFIEYLKAESNMEELLKYLKSNGYQLAMLTNRGSNLSGIIEHYKLNNYFDPIITTEKAKPKPEPEGILLILDKWKLDKDEVVFIGDSFSDQKAANNAGINFWSFNNNDLDADLLLPNFKYFIEIVSQFNTYKNKRK